MARDCREPECGAHQTNKDVLCVQDDELCVQNVLCVQDDVLCVQGPAESSSVGNGLGDSNYSYMSKVQVTSNDVADATAVCSRDSLRLSRQSLQSQATQVQRASGYATRSSKSIRIFRVKRPRSKGPAVMQLEVFTVFEVFRKSSYSADMHLYDKRLSITMTQQSK